MIGEKGWGSAREMRTGMLEPVIASLTVAAAVTKRLSGTKGWDLCCCRCSPTHLLLLRPFNLAAVAPFRTANETSHPITA